MSSLRLDRLLRPRSVAIVGVSSTPGSLGANVLKNLDHAGFVGNLHLVNPKRTEVFGRPCLQSVDALPEQVDCAVLAIPRVSVLETLRACANRKVASAIVFSSGFAESGSQGLAEQEEITRIARESNMVILGPNCLGSLNYVDNVALTFINMPATKLEPGRQGVAVISQSGAMAAVLVVNLSARRVGISYSVSTGNEAVSGVEDYVDYMIDDPATKVITMIVEQFRNPRRFLALAGRAHRRGKKIVLLHPGSSTAGGASAATHTGAMAGNYQTMRTKVRNAGVVFVDTLEQLADVSELMVRLPSMPVGGAAILAESGAYKAMALDFCEKIGLELPPFTPSVDAALRAVLPDFIPPTNPMDLTAQALVDPDIYRRTLPLMIGDPRCGSLVLAIILTDESTSGLKLPPILDAIRALQAQPDYSPKPIIFAGMDEGARILPDFIEELRKLGVTFFPTPERALQALSIVTESSALQQRKAIPESTPLPRPPLAIIPEHGVIPEYRSKEILKSVGIPVPEGALARSPEEAAKIAHQIGFPVVLKAQSANLSHKSDVGGVILNLKDASAVAEGWAQLQSNIARKMPELILDGVLVEKMGAPGVELIVGARNDPEWGPVLMVGLGGVLAEALRDIRLLPPDLPVEAIMAELYKLSGAAVLRGFRGAAAPDLRAAAEIISALGRLVLSTESIREVDLNPVVIYPNGDGAVALDALIVSA